MKKILLKTWPFLTICFVVAVFFWKVVLLGQIPIPGDFIVGTYFPWLDYKWGYQVGVPVKNPITSDVVSIFYPLRSNAVDQLKGGHLPLWNSLMFTGTPLLADFQVGVLSPTILFYFILPKVWGWAFQVMTQPLLAAIFMYLLLRNFGLKKPASLFGGIFYAFSAFNIVWMEWNSYTLVAAFIPLIILLTDKFIRSKKLFWGIFLGLGICLQIISGYPQLVIYTLTAIVLFAFFRREKLDLRTILLLSVFVMAGIFLSSVITIPGFEFVLNSQKKYEVLSQEFAYFPWQNLITFLSPDYFGNPATMNYFGAGNYIVNLGYSGIVVLILSIAGILKDWKKREVKYFTSLFGLSLFFCLPTPFTNAIFNFPIISSLSLTKVLVLANLSLAALAGFGIGNLLEMNKVKKVIYIFIPFLILLVLAIFTFLTKFHLEITLRNLVLPVLLSVVAPLLIILRKKIFIFILCVIAIAELFRYGWKYTPFSSPNLVFPETPILSYFKDEKEPYRVSLGNVIPMNMLVPYGIETVSGYDAFFPVWWARLNVAISSKSSRNTNLSYYSPFGQYDSPWFDLLNNEYLLVNVKERDFIYEVQKDKKFQEVFSDKSVTVYRNNDSFPRAFFVTDWEVKTGIDELSALIDPNFPLERKIIINKDINLEKSIGGHGEVSYDFYSPEKSVLTVKNDKEGFLFVSDAWYPGWKVTVDGREATIYRADYAFRAVPVTSGIHKVEFIYDPESLKIGKLLSLATILFLAGVVLYDVKKYY